MPDVNSYVVLHPLEVPHCPEGEHMTHGPCPDCGSHPSFSYSQAAANCPRCRGSIGEAGPELGMAPCTHAGTTYAPGQTVKLTEAQAAGFGDKVAPAGSQNLDELMVRAAAARLGLTVSAPAAVGISGELHAEGIPG